MRFEPTISEPQILEKITMYLTKLFDEVQNRDHLASHSRKVYRNAGVKFQAWVEQTHGIASEKQRAGLLNVKTCGEYKKHLSEHHKPNTARIHLRVLKIASEQAMRSGLELDISLHALRLPRKPQAEFKGLTEDEVVNALLVSGTRSPRDHLIFRFMLGTGLRVSELVGLDEYQIEGRWLRNICGKAESIRDVPLPSALLPDLNAYLDFKRGSGLDTLPLFVSNRNSRFNPKTIYKIISGILCQAKVPRERCTNHTLRHTFAIRALRKLGNEYNQATAVSMVQKLLGHRYRLTTEGYLTEDNETIAEGLE
jgi:integrase